MRLGPGLLYEGRTLQGACPKLADFCSATMAEFYSAVDIFVHFLLLIWECRYTEVLQHVHTLGFAMAGTLHTKEYKILIEALVAERTSRGLSQAALAMALKRPPSFVAKVELRERRLDVLEFCAWSYALSVDPLEQLRKSASLPLKSIPR